MLVCLCVCMYVRIYVYIYVCVWQSRIARIGVPDVLSRERIYFVALADFYLSGMELVRISTHCLLIFDTNEPVDIVDMLLLQ